MLRPRFADLKKLFLNTFVILSCLQIALTAVFYLDHKWSAIDAWESTHLWVITALLADAFVGFAIAIFSLYDVFKLFKEVDELDTIFNQAPIGIFTIKSDYTVETVNQKMLDMIGKKIPQDIIGVNALTLNCLSGFEKHFDLCFQGQPFERPVECFTKTGERIYHYYRGVPIFNRETKVFDRLLLMGSNVAKQKELENKLANHSLELEKQVSEKTKGMQDKILELKMSETAMLNILEDVRSLEKKLRDERDRANAVLSSMGEGLVLTDGELNILFVNQRASGLLRLAPDDIAGKKVTEILRLITAKKKERYDFEKNCKEIIEKKDILRLGLENDLYCEVNGGKGFPVAFVISPFLSEDINGLVIVFHDVTKEKELDQARTDFISIASHQLRAPLTSVRWYIEMLENGDGGALKVKQKTFVDKIYQGSLRLNETINLLLSLARLESGKTADKLSEVEIKPFVEGILQELRPMMTGKTLQIETKFSKGFSKFNFFAGELRQVLVNLVSNAIRYTNETGKISINITKNKDEFGVEVSDNGVGIPEDQQNKIFEKFFRATNAVTKISDGSGLGLALAKIIVEKWGGKIWFKSQEGKGASFYFTVPVSDTN